MSLKEDRGHKKRKQHNYQNGGGDKAEAKKKTATKRNDVRIGGGYASRDETSHY